MVRRTQEANHEPPRSLQAVESGSTITAIASQHLSQNVEPTNATATSAVACATTEFGMAAAIAKHAAATISKPMVMATAVSSRLTHGDKIKCQATLTSQEIKQDLPSISDDETVAIQMVSTEIGIADQTVSTYRVFGEGLYRTTACEPTSFTIEALTSRGERPRRGGESLFVAIRGVARGRARIIDHCNGTYTVDWRPTVSGRYTIAISNLGEPLPGSPFVCVASTPEPIAANCIVRGGALHEAVARESQSFEVLQRIHCTNIFRLICPASGLLTHVGLHLLWTTHMHMSCRRWAFETN